MKNNFKDLTGQRFGMLLVVERAPNRGDRVAWWTCCDCGEIKLVTGHSLKNGATKSCGRHRGTHGHTAQFKMSPEYTSYHLAKGRCRNPNHHKFPDYGGRGIEFRFDSFEQFLTEIGLRPEPKFDYSLDRIDVNGHYEPGNVRWATRSQQQNNQRRNQPSLLAKLHAPSTVCLC